MNYPRPDPDCPECHGRGKRPVRIAHEDGHIVVTERCPCTDLDGRRQIAAAMIEALGRSAKPPQG